MSPDRCRVCDARTARFATAAVLAKYQVGYFECSACGFVQTEEPHWLAEAYESAIVQSDIGSVFRSRLCSNSTKAVLEWFFDPSGRFVDYGGGYGLFVREMRDRGYDFRIFDKYTKNLFAQGFEVDPAGRERFDLLTAFEVLEHLADPVAEIESMLRLSDSLLVTTEILPVPRPDPAAWWYYAPEHGQHIAFYTVRALRVIADRFRLNLATNGTSLHLLSRRRVGERAFRFVTRPKVAGWLDLMRSRPSLLPGDYEAAIGRLRAIRRAEAGDLGA